MTKNGSFKHVKGKFVGKKGVLHDMRSAPKLVEGLEQAGEDIAKSAENKAREHSYYDPQEDEFAVKSYQGRKDPQGRWQVWVQAIGTGAWLSERDDAALTEAAAQEYHKHGLKKSNKANGGK